MFTWIIVNYKKVIAVTTAFITLIAVPLWLSAFGFILETKTANAVTMENQSRVQKLESSINKFDGKLEIIQGYLERAERRDRREK